MIYVLRSRGAMKGLSARVKEEKKIRPVRTPALKRGQRVQVCNRVEGLDKKQILVERGGG